MKFYDLIKNNSSEDIEKYINIIISNLEKDSKENNNTNIIGFKIFHNPVGYYLLNKNKKELFNVNMRSFYGGYVPKGMNIVYGLSVDDNCIASNAGMYYTVDDDSYIYDFCKYIKDKDISCETDFFEYVLFFLKSYFGTFNNRSRDDMFQMILKNDRIYHNPIGVHKLSDFKHKGNAKCSEYAVMANNILNVFGFDCSIIIGQIKLDDEDMEGHAYNLVSYTDENNEKKDILIDFASSVNVYDVNYNKLGESPYIMYLDSFDENIVVDLLYNDLHLTYDDYDYMVLGDSLLQLGNGKTRDYFVSSKLYLKKDLKSKQN